MATDLSKTRIDRLGDRVKTGNISDTDLRLLDQYRLSFSKPYEHVIGKIREDLKLQPTGRPAKSTTSISDKLQRESIRLSQTQDIAGCRLVVEDTIQQDDLIKSLEVLFDNIRIVDRRENPSHGYRAVHAIVDCLGKQIEIQVRTSLQHLWAEFSEKLSDVKDPSIKYGGGDSQMQRLLKEMSLLIFKHEIIESGIKKQLVQWSSDDNVPESTKRDLERIHEMALETRQKLFESLRNRIGEM